MTVTITENRRIGPGLHLLKFSSDVANATFSVFLDGILFQRGRSGEARVPIAQDETIEVDVYDDNSVPGRRYPKRARLVWQGQSSVKTWVIERSSDGSTYTEVARIPSQGHVERYMSNVLATGTYWFRVQGLGDNGNVTQKIVQRVNIVARPAAMGSVEVTGVTAGVATINEV